MVDLLGKKLVSFQLPPAAIKGDKDSRAIRKTITEMTRPFGLQEKLHVGMVTDTGTTMVECVVCGPSPPNVCVTVCALVIVCV
jgi:hypothetical protein